MFHGYTFNTLKIQLSRALLLLDILIFVKIIKEIIVYVALWNASAKCTCHNENCPPPNYIIFLVVSDYVFIAVGGLAQICFFPKYIYYGRTHNLEVGGLNLTATMHVVEKN